MKNIKILSIFWLIALLVSACSGSPRTITVNNAWARPGSAGENGAAYFVIENGTGVNDTLLSVSSDIASAAEVHMSMADDNGVMSMQMQESVPVLAKDQVEFKPGGLHVMLVALTQDLNVGDTIPVTLKFEKAGSIKVDVSVREP